MSDKPKKEKKEKKKKSNLKETQQKNIQDKSSNKNDIFSMLDRLDKVSIAKSRITEGKLRKGLIENQPVKETSEQKDQQTSISQLKVEIDELRQLKNDYYERGEINKSIEIAEKIINKAKNSNMKLILNEEQEFIQKVQEKTTPIKPVNDQINELKQKRHIYYTQEKFDEAIQIAKIIIELAKENNLTNLIKGERNFINLMEEKILDKIKTKESDTIEDLEIKKIKEETEDNSKHVLEIKLTKDKLDEEIRKLEEEKKNFKEEMLKFEELQKAFEYEKQMFEELKKFEKGKILDDNEEIKTKSYQEELNKLKEEQKNFEEEKLKFLQEKNEFEEQKKILEQDKLKLKEEKEAFEWEKNMFEDAKKYEFEKKSSI